MNENDEDDNIRESMVDLDKLNQDDDDEEVEYYEPRISREDIKLHISGTILSMIGV